MKTLRKFLSLVLSLCIATYALPGLASTVSSEADAVKVELTDEAMNQAVGAGAVDATMADLYPGQKVATAVIANRSILICDYSLNAVDWNGVVIRTLASGSLAPNTAVVVEGDISGKPWSITGEFYQAKISNGGVPGFLSLDTTSQ